MCVLSRRSAATAAGDLVQRQALYCHRVLRTVKASVEATKCLTRDSFECLLKFLLGICDVLLAPPTVKGICDVLLSPPTVKGTCRSSQVKEHLVR